MKIALISFTKDGAEICAKLEAGLAQAGYECAAYGNDRFADRTGIRPLKVGLGAWTAAAFPGNDALVFVGAVGIAVRAIAPHVKDKTVDPAVVVVDEKGQYAISLLSGHLGGANDLAMEIAGLIGAQPVVTTATDLNLRFAVDNWAKENGLRIGDMKLAKEISAAILRGETIGVVSDVPIEGELPAQLIDLEAATEASGFQRSAESAVVPVTDRAIPEMGIRISVYEGSGPFEKTLHLIPRTVSVGIGCRKRTPPETVAEVFEKAIKDCKLSAESVEQICTIDIKKDEPALQQLAENLGVPLRTFSAAELDQMEGEFTSSEFVRGITGVDNVCERSAVLGSHGGLIARKQALNGVTAAIAVRTGGIRWKQQ